MWAACRPHSVASCRTLMIAAMPSEKPRTTGLAMNAAMAPRPSALHSRNSSPLEMTSAADNAICCPPVIPGMAGSAAASTAAEDEVAATMA